MTYDSKDEDSFKCYENNSVLTFLQGRWIILSRHSQLKNNVFNTVAEHIVGFSEIQIKKYK